jgi:NADPH:quinone reductase-like Zn-dependent oxidoreductase
LTPANISFASAAAAPMAAITALQGLRDHGHIQPGQRVLINGASGGVGSFAVQLAKVFGAEVTAVCSTSKVETARWLGADRVIDYSQQDFTQTGQPYDLIFDTVGNRSIADCRRALSPQGRFVTTAFLPALLLQGLLPFQGGQQVMRSMLVKPNREDLGFIGELLATGQLQALIDRSYPAERVTDAFYYLGEGHAAGKVVLWMNADEGATTHAPSVGAVSV